MKVAIIRYEWKEYKQHHTTLHKDYYYTVGCGDNFVVLTCKPYYNIQCDKVDDYYESYFEKVYNVIKHNIASRKPTTCCVAYSKRMNASIHEFLTQCNTLICPRYCTIVTIRNNLLYITTVRAISRVLSNIGKSFVKIAMDVSVGVKDYPPSEYIDPSETLVLERFKHSDYTRLVGSLSSLKARSEEGQRVMLKQRVIDDIATDAKVSTEQVKCVVSGWAESSVSHQSICIQQAAKDIFGIKKTTFFDTLAKGTGHDTDHDHYSMVQAIYNNTQKHLKALNIDKVFLYRGLTLTESVEYIVGKRDFCSFNPLSSFSNCYETAYNFSEPGCNIGPYDQHNFPFILGGWFPSELIFSTPLTGIGCHLELEFVVLGGEHCVYVDPLIFTSIRVAFDQNFDIRPTKLRQIESFEPGRIMTDKDEYITNRTIDEIAAILNTDSETAIQVAKGNEVDYMAESSSSTNVDCDINNADWCKMSWDLPPYKSKEFMQHLKRNNTTLEAFKLLPVYKHALRKGTIQE